MAGQRQPIDLIVTKGNKHIGKAEIEERRAKEVRAPTGDVTPPKYLPAKLRAEFNDIADKLIKINIMTELDVDLLSRYLMAKQTYITLDKEYTKLLNADELDIPRMDKISNMLDKAFKQCQSGARDLGLTISSRCKLVVPQPEEKPESKFGGFITGTG